MVKRGIVFTSVLVLAAAPRAAAAETYAVGPGRAHRDLQSVADLLRPGDRVELDGGVTYPGGVVLRAGGTREARITITGRRAGGRRPVITGGATTIEVRGGHVVIEGVEITGGAARCFFHHADDVTLRDSFVHDCPQHGVLGADGDAGSLTLSYVEVARAGRGDGAHPIYVATDEEAFPRSVFRMEHCFVHDASGGNSVKSRAERNEIYANWIEGEPFHALELIGPDGAARKRSREDSDVVGNVIVKLGRGSAIRVGGDGSGESNGRYRFVSNTIVLGPEVRAAFRLYNGLESIEMHNNAIARRGGGPIRVVVEEEVRWAAGRAVLHGSHNWIPMGSSGVPAAWTGTIAGRDPGFVSEIDLRPAPGSPLVGAAAPPPPSPAPFAFPAPLEAPRELPPPRSIERVGAAVSRLDAAADIGAFPFVAGAHRAPLAAPAPPPRGCGCHGAATAGAPAGPIMLAIGGAFASRRRRSARARGAARAKMADGSACRFSPASSACWSSRTCGRTSSSASSATTTSSTSS